MNNHQLKRPRYWLGPFLAGACFAIGYGFVKRIDDFEVFKFTSDQILFQPKPFDSEIDTRFK